MELELWEDAAGEKFGVAVTPVVVPLRLRYNEAGIDGLVSPKPPGAAAKLTAAQMAELREPVLAGPDPKTHKVISWRCLDLRAEIARRFSVTVPERTIGKWLCKLKLTRLQPRPNHPKKDAAA